MFALKLFSNGQRQEATLPTNPQDWSLKGLEQYLATLNARKQTHRTLVQQLQKTLEDAMLVECRGPYTSAQMVLQSEVRFLPIQLRVYRELHEATQLFLW